MYNKKAVLWSARSRCTFQCMFQFYKTKTKNGMRREIDVRPQQQQQRKKPKQPIQPSSFSTFLQPFEMCVQLISLPLQTNLDLW